jgi:CheY-like chemotaxis protein
MAKILIVDDEAAVCNAVDVMLSLEGHTVIHAEDGVKALESIKKNLPDVVVCDIEMPNLRGLMFLKNCAKIMQYPIFLSSS